MRKKIFTVRHSTCSSYLLSMYGAFCLHSALTEISFSLSSSLPCVVRIEFKSTALLNRIQCCIMRIFLGDIWCMIQQMRNSGGFVLKCIDSDIFRSIWSIESVFWNPFKFSGFVMCVWRLNTCWFGLKLFNSELFGAEPLDSKLFSKFWTPGLQFTEFWTPGLQVSEFWTPGF